MCFKRANTEQTIFAGKKAIIQDLQILIGYMLLLINYLLTTKSIKFGTKNIDLSGNP